MGKYVTANGFNRPTLQDIKAQLEEGFKGVFGPSFDTNQDSPNGYLVSMLALSLSDVYELGQMIYDAHRPTSAEGVSLDDILTLCSLRRLSASATTGYAAVFTDSSDSIVTIPKGSVAKTGSGYSFTLDSATEIGVNVGDEVFHTAAVVCMEDLSVGGYYDLEYVCKDSSGAYKHVSNRVTSTGDKADDAKSMASKINEKGLLKAFSDEERVYIYNRILHFKLVTSDKVVAEGFGSFGSFTCTELGKIKVVSGELNIPGDVDGWTSVYNIDVMSTGSDKEDDSSARIRIQSNVDSVRSFGTDESIAANLIDSVDGVTLAVVKSNRSMTEDGEGRPPKSFEAIVAGGNDNEVAKCILDNTCCGIQPYGSTQIKLYDGNGDEVIVGFSRPQPMYLWIRVDGTYYKEEEFPTDGIDRVKNSIKDWADVEYTIGKDVIPDRIKTAVYNVNGIGPVAVKIALTSSPSSAPTYTESVYGMPSYGYAVADISRITINLR